MIVKPALVGLAALHLSGLVLGQATEAEMEAILGPPTVEDTPTRYIVRFSDSGSARFRKRDDTLVSRRDDLRARISQDAPGVVPPLPYSVSTKPLTIASPPSRRKPRASSASWPGPSPMSSP